MRKKTTATLVYATLLALIVTVSPAAAQTPKGDVAFGYSALFASDVNTPAGWLFAGAGRIADTNLSFVGEVQGHYKTIAGISASVHAFMGGARFSGGTSPKVKGFGQMLVGVAHAGASFAGQSASTNKFALQPGVGVDIMAGARAFVRFQGDWFLVVFGNGAGTSKDFRIGISLGVPIGG